MSSLFNEHEPPEHGCRHPYFALIPLSTGAICRKHKNISYGLYRGWLGDDIYLDAIKSTNYGKNFRGVWDNAYSRDVPGKEVNANKPLLERIIKASVPQDEKVIKWRSVYREDPIEFRDYMVVTCLTVKPLLP